MLKFLFIALMVMMPLAASAQPVTKGSVQRLNLDSVTIDGTIVTSSGAELNIVDGVTATAAELNYVDLATLGTGAVSKAVVLDASGDYTYPATYTGVIPSSGTETFQSGSTLTVAGTLATTGSVTATGSVVSTRTTSANSATTNRAFSVLLTAPVDTTGTNTHTGYNFTPTISNASGGTNTVNGFNFSNYTGDAQVNVNAVNIGTSDGLGTANAVSIGTGWDAGIVTDSPVKINSTNGTAISAIRFAFDAVASGQTSKTTTLTGVTSSSRCVATFAEVATNSISMRAAVPGTDQVVVTVSADPGASNQDFTVMCMN